MKPIAELLRYLSHPAITEIALTTGRCPMIKSINGYEPVDSAVLTDEELNRTLLTMVGPARAASVSEKPMKWSVRAEGVATLAVIAVRRGEGLSMRVMRTGDGAAAGTKPLETTPAPGSGVNAAAAASTASAVTEQSPAEPSEDGAPASPRDMVPPMVAPLVPPVRRPSVAGLRVIKATSPQVPAPPPPEVAPVASAPVPPPAPMAFPPPVSAPVVPPPPPRSSPPQASAPLTPPPPPVFESPLDAELPPLPPSSEPPVSAKAPPPPPPSEEVSSIDISIQEEPTQEEPAREKPAREEHTPPLAYRPALPPRSRPDFWRDLPALMEEARRIGASDLHLVAGRPALFRVAGELRPDGESLPPKRVEQMVLSQVPARLRSVFERDGSCDFALQTEASGRFRVNVCRQRTGLKGTFRVILREQPSLESLGLPAEFIRATRHSHGLILITGPSGHGKTSTLAALVDILNRETKRHILTVEDPVEFVHPRKRALISQREVGTHTRSVVSALKGALREDADVIVVGELRDAEAVRLALTANETGRLVLATMNTPSVAKTLERIIDLFPAGDVPQVRRMLASHLKLLVSQRLLPTTDGGGMVAAAEVLPGSVALSHLIREGRLAELPSLQRRGEELGIVRLDAALAALVRARKTTLEIAKGFAEDPEALEAEVSGPAPELPPEPSAGGRKLANPVGPMMGRKSA